MQAAQLPTILLIALLAGAPASSRAFDLSFLGQAPLRFLTDADTQLLSETINEVLTNAADGESRTWKGEQSGTSGTVTAVRTFAEDERRCRRIEIVTLSPRATKGRGSSLVDMCEIEGRWRILRVPR
jgi:surface antigen